MIGLIKSYVTVGLFYSLLVLFITYRSKGLVMLDLIKSYVTVGLMYSLLVLFITPIGREMTLEKSNLYIFFEVIVCIILWPYIVYNILFRRGL